MRHIAGVLAPVVRHQAHSALPLDLRIAPIVLAVALMAAVVAAVLVAFARNGARVGPGSITAQVTADLKHREGASR
jgi:hypothetical protein